MCANEKSNSVDDAQLEREVRAGRKFSLSEAIGRLGGGDLMKGASPVTRRRQAELEIERYLERNLFDGEGALEIVLLRRVKESDIFLNADYECPLEALSAYCQRVLDADALLKSFVTEVDAQWGRMYLERPYFQKDGAPPHGDDPYTFTSVRSKLTRLVEGLRTA